MPTADEIKRDLAGIVSDFDGREFSGDIDDDTLFFADLGFASIDAVVLAEKLETHYGRKLAFPEFVAGMAARNVQDIAVGDLVAFLHGKLNGGA